MGSVSSVSSGSRGSRTQGRLLALRGTSTTQSRLLALRSTGVPGVLLRSQGMDAAVETSEELLVSAEYLLVEPLDSSSVKPAHSEAATVDIELMLDAVHLR